MKLKGSLWISNIDSKCVCSAVSRGDLVDEKSLFLLCVTWLDTTLSLHQRMRVPALRLQLIKSEAQVTELLYLLLLTQPVCAQAG